MASALGTGGIPLQELGGSAIGSEGKHQVREGTGNSPVSLLGHRGVFPCHFPFHTHRGWGFSIFVQEILNSWLNSMTFNNYELLHATMFVEWMNRSRPIFVAFPPPDCFSGDTRMSETSGIHWKIVIELVVCTQHSCSPDGREVHLFYHSHQWQLNSLHSKHTLT